MKNAIVLGASSGIGKELSLILTENNYRVVITGRREDKLSEIAAKKPDKFLVKSFDCTNVDNIRILSEIANEVGDIDLIIVSAGTGDLNEQLDYNTENTTNQLNVIAFSQIMNFAYKYFKDRGTGHIVVISSVAGIRGGRVSPAYNASKSYQISYTEGIRQKICKEKLSVSLTDIRPGLVDTDMAKGEGLFWVSPVDKAARQIYKAIKKKKSVVYVTRRWRIIAGLLKILPNFIIKKL